MSNASASVPLSVQVNTSFSVSVAPTGVPISTSASVFSATERVTVAPSVNTGAVLTREITDKGKDSDLTSA